MISDTSTHVHEAILDSLVVELPFGDEHAIVRTADDTIYRLGAAVRPSDATHALLADRVRGETVRVRLD